MMFLRTLSRIFAFLGVAVALYDACYHWFLKNKFHIRPLKDLWTDFHKASYTEALPHLKAVFSNWDIIAGWPAPVVLLAIAAIFYVLYRLIFAARGGRGGGGFNYKSPD